MKKTAEIIRIITAPSIMAALSAVVLCIGGHMSMGETLWSVLWLCIIPCLAYVVAWIIPDLRKKGRKAQRRLAVIFSVIGYIGAMATAFVTGGSVVLKVYSCTYLLSGVCIALCSLLGFRASGHACGTSGPVAVLCVFSGLWWLTGLSVLALVMWSSLVMKRHTFLELVVGSVISLAALCVSVMLFC